MTDSASRDNSFLKDQNKTKDQLITELVELRERMAEQDAQIAKCQQAEADHRHINDSLPVLVATAGLDGYYRDVNATFERTLSWSKEESLSRPFIEFIHPDDRAAAVETFKQLESGETVTSFVDRNVCKDGSYRWFRWVVIPVLDRGIVFGIGQDITERVQAEKSLQEAHDELEQQVEQRTAELKAANQQLKREVEERRQAEATLDAFFGASTAVLNILDEEMRYVKSDGLTPTYFGLDSQSIIGRSAREFVPEFMDSISPMIQQVIEFGKPIHNVEIRGPVPSRSGAFAYWCVSYFPVPLPKGKRGFGIIGTEITHRKRAEEKLQQSHDELRAIYDRMVDGLLITDIETLRFVRANSSICRMLGYTEPELLSLSVRDLHPPDVIPRIIETIRAAERLAEPPVAAFPVRRKDGSVFYAEVIGNFLIYDGRPCSIGIFRDITERKRAQEALERERRTLFHMLRASDHERQVISYDIHDGLAQQLASAIMQLQAYDALKKHDPGKAKTVYDAGVEMLRQAHAEARRLISGVRPPILDESGITAALAHLVYDHSTPTGPKVGFHGDMKVGRLAKVLENAIYRIAQEALANALQHSRSERVKVSLIQDNNDLRLEVQDWGVGFDPEAVDGNRFGLEGIKERTRLLGGECSVESEPEEGTCVRVVLPVLQQE